MRCGPVCLRTEANASPIAFAFDRGRIAGLQCHRMLAPHILETVLALPAADQLELIDRVRQRLRQAAWPLTAAQQLMLDEEINAFAADGDMGLPWDEVEAEIRSTLGGR